MWRAIGSLAERDYISEGRVRRAKESSTKSRHRSRTRYRKLLVVALVAIFIAVVLVAANIDPFALWTRVGARLAERKALQSHRTAIPVPTGVVQPEPVGTDSSVSKNPLKLILTGTVPGRNAYEGIAYIGVSAFSPQTYAAGAILANGARLQQIHKDYVILARGKHTVRLYVTGREPPGYNVASQGALLEVGGMSPATSAKATSDDALSSVIRAAPVFAGSQNGFAGVVVYSGHQSQAFARLGLHEGDVITAIDGTPLADEQSAVDALRPLMKGAALTATIRRGMVTQTVSLDGTAL